MAERDVNSIERAKETLYEVARDHAALTQKDMGMAEDAIFAVVDESRKALQYSWKKSASWWWQARDSARVIQKTLSEILDSGEIHTRWVKMRLMALHDQLDRIISGATERTGHG